MQTISIKDTRDNLAELIEKVAIGKKTFIITKFGKPKAQLTPVEKKKTMKRSGLEAAFGMWEDRQDMQDSAKWVAEMRSKWSKRYE